MNLVEILGCLRAGKKFKRDIQFRNPGPFRGPSRRAVALRGDESDQRKEEIETITRAEAKEDPLHFEYAHTRAHTRIAVH